jgi:hypothetical protein
MTTFFRARVSVLWGDRAICEFLHKADLGVTGAGVRETITIDYKPGVEIDEDRVCKTLSETVRLSDAENTKIKILAFNVLSIERVTGVLCTDRSATAEILSAASSPSARAPTPRQ